MRERCQLINVDVDLDIDFRNVYGYTTTFWVFWTAYFNALYFPFI